MQIETQLLLLFSECIFGDKRYELEQTWTPDLGQPFGVMYCIHCECVAVSEKKGATVAARGKAALI